MADDQVRLRAMWIERAALWLRGHERPFLADNLERCVLAGVGFSLSMTEYFHIVTLSADPQTADALKPFAGEGEDAWVRRALTATDPAPLRMTKAPMAQVEIKWQVRPHATPSSGRLSGTLASRAPIEYNGMRFRSHTETRIAEALDEANVLYFPLPVAVRHRVRFEVDFLVIHKGRVGVLEVDGPTHKPTTRAYEDSRAAWFEKSGIALFRHYPVSAVDDGPAAVIEDFLNDLRGPRF
jgi:hypothetical protein